MRRLICIACLLTLPWTALAQDEPEEPAEYEPTISAALEEFGAGRWAEARALFLRAHTLLPNARTLRGVGMAAFELRDYVAAVEALEGSLQHPVRPLTEEHAAQVQVLLTRARAFVGRLEIPAAPDGSRLNVDGERMEVAGWPAAPAAIQLAIGEHELTIRTPDGRAAAARVRVVGGEDRALDVDVAPLYPPEPDPVALEPHEAAPTEVGEPTPAVPAPPPSSDPWIVVGSGVSAAIVGAVLLALGVADQTAVESAPPGTPWPAVSGAYERAPIMTGVGIALLGAGIAVAGVGLVWGLTMTPSETRASLSLGGRF